MNPITRAGVFGTTLPLLLISSLVLAEDAVTQLDEVVVTANRAARTVDDSMAAVSVVTREDIESIQAQDVIDVLRLQPGINISRNGGKGNSTNVFIRGSESDQVLVLIDGVRVNSATLGGFDWSNLPIDQVERIEIVRGVRTALYGSDAIGGVVQIFTRKKAGSYASLAYGKYKTKRGSAGFSTGDKTKFSINLAAEKSDGFSATNQNNSSFDPDKDGYDKKSATISLSHQLNKDTKLGINTFYSENEAGYDQGDTDSDLRTISAYLQSEFSDSWSHKLDLKSSKDQAVFLSSFGASTFNTKREEVNWLNDISLSDNINVLVGLNHRKVKGESVGSYKDSIKNDAFFSNLNYLKGRYNVDVATRYDNHSKAGNKWTGQLATGFQLTPSINTYISIGSAFKAPTVNELFNPPSSFGSYAGNPNLKPENSKSVEIGVKSKIGSNQRIEATLYRTTVSDLISFSGVNNQAINTDKATMEGLELGYSGQKNKFNWGANLTLQSAKDNATSQRLLRRPNTKATLNLGYAPTSGTHLNVDATYASSREDLTSTFPSYTLTNPSYTLLNLAVDKQLTKHTSVGIRVENVTDKDFELAYSYNTSGRAAFITFNYNLNQ